MTNQLLEQVEANYKLQNELNDVKQRLHSRNQLIDTMRASILKKCLGKDYSRTKIQKYQNVPSEELLGILFRSRQDQSPEEEFDSAVTSECLGVVKGEASQGQGNELVYRKRVLTPHTLRNLEAKIRALQQNNQTLEAERQSYNTEVAAFKETTEKLCFARKLNEDLSTQVDNMRKQRDSIKAKLKGETQCVEKLSAQLEKVMKHLQHEMVSRKKCEMQVNEQAKRLSASKKKQAFLAKKNIELQKLISQTKKSSSILEDQLTLMDRKYIELRKTLDWTRTNSQKELKRVQSERDQFKTRLLLQDKQ